MLVVVLFFLLPKWPSSSVVVVLVLANVVLFRPFPGKIRVVGP